LVNKQNPNNNNSK